MGPKPIKLSEEMASMDNDWKIPMSFAAVEKLLTECSSIGDELGKMLEMPTTPEAAEVALLKAVLEKRDLTSKLEATTIRVDSLYRNFVEIRIRQLEVGKAPEPAKIEPTKEQVAGG
jgi:hypothetical protein